MNLRARLKSRIFDLAVAWGLPERGAPPLRNANHFFLHRIVADMAREPGGEFWAQLPGQALDREVVRRRLELLRRRMRFVSADEYFAAADEPGLATLSFDDSYADLLTTSQPFLEEIGVPALCYLIVEPLRRRQLIWSDQVYSSFAASPTVPEIVLRELDGLRVDVSTLPARVAASMRLCGRLMTMPAIRRDAVVGEIVSLLGAGPFRVDELYLTEDQARELSRRPNITIGSHTMTHPSLPLLSVRELEDELANSKAALEALTGRPVRHLSYPYGHFSQQVCFSAKRCGYASATATGKVGMGFPFAWRRTNLGLWSDTEFTVRTSGVFQRFVGQK